MAVNSMTALDLSAVLSLSLDSRPSATRYHGWRVALVTYALAADLKPAERSSAFLAGLLHDVGCASLSSHATADLRLPKPPSTSKARMHPVHSAAILRRIPGFTPAADILECHHEWWDGTGYPRGLKRDEIPLPAQYIRIADSAVINKCFESKDDLKDALQRMHRNTGTEWSTDVWARFLKTLRNGAIPKEIIHELDLPKLIRNVAHEAVESLSDTSEEILDILFETFRNLIDACSSCNSGHSERVTLWAIEFAKAMKLSDEEIRKLKWAACVHDVGKMALPPTLLDKADKLSRDELDMVRSHSDITGRFLRVLPDCPWLVEIADIACAHHERYDGKGYPKGFAGEAIPLAARILAVADAFDAMTTPRAYRTGMSPGAAMQRLQLNSGTQFDPDVVDAVGSLYRRDMGKFLSATVAGVSLTTSEEPSNPFSGLDALRL